LLNLLPDSTVAMPKPKHTLLPVLVVLFVASYGLMTMLIVEQGRTIDTQRFLIGQLFTDSNQLNAIKSSALRRQIEAQAKARAQAQTPSSQAAQQDKKSKVQHPAPQKPPKDTADSSDVRRSLITI
jgi:hypothetical protein